MDDDTLGLKVIAVFILFLILMFNCVHTSPILDDKKSPYIVKKVKDTWIYTGKARYYGKAYSGEMFCPKPLILDIGRYNIGDTIYFKNDTIN